MVKIIVVLIIIAAACFTLGVLVGSALTKGRNKP